MANYKYKVDIENRNILINDPPVRFPFNSRNLLDKIFIRCERADNGCLVWTGGVTESGHVQIRHNKVAYYASRLVLYSYDIDFDFSKHQALHNCPDKDNPSCLERTHLWRGTNADNIRDAAIKGSYSNHTKEQVLSLLEDWKTGNYTQAALARKYHYGPDEVSRIVRGERWKYIGLCQG